MGKASASNAPNKWANWGMIKMIEFGVFAAINYDSRQHTGRNHYQINIIDFAV